MFDAYAAFDFIAFTILSVRLSALWFCRETTAQIAAGIHPTIVIWRIKQRTPVVFYREA